jgi:hypothetical protein
VKEPLYTGAAMGLAINCLPGGTWCRSYAMSVSTIVVACSIGEAIAVDVVATDALALRVHALASEDFLLLATALLGLLFLTRNAAA